MNSDTAKQLSDAIELNCSSLVPEIDQLSKQYQMAEVLEIMIDSASESLRIKIANSPSAGTHCTYSGGKPVCSEIPGENILGDTPPLDSKMPQKFCTDIASKVFHVMSALTQSVKEIDENFKVLLIVKPDTVSNRQTMFCKHVDDAIQGNFFQYSDS
jgi:hypothetical protein